MTTASGCVQTLECPGSRKEQLHKHTREINLGIANDGGKEEEGKTMKRNKEQKIVTLLHKKFYVVIELIFRVQPRKGQHLNTSLLCAKVYLLFTISSCFLIHSLAIRFSHSLFLFAFPLLFVFRDEINIFAFLYHTVLSIF
jgi:hypothetical protein